MLLIIVSVLHNNLLNRLLFICASLLNIFPSCVSDKDSRIAGACWLGAELRSSERSCLKEIRWGVCRAGCLPQASLSRVCTQHTRKHADTHLHTHKHTHVCAHTCACMHPVHPPGDPQNQTDLAALPDDRFLVCFRRTRDFENSCLIDPESLRLCT